jgi:hypothetical protein
MLSVSKMPILLSVVMLKVVMLSVMAPHKLQQKSSMKLAADCNFDEKANSI